MVVSEAKKFPLEDLEDVSASSKNEGNQLKFYLNIFKRKWLVILLFCVLGFIPAFLLSRRDITYYPGLFEMQVEPISSEEKLTDPSVLARIGTQIDSNLLRFDYPTIIRILKSPDILKEIATRVSQQDPRASKEFVLQTLIENLIVEQARQGKGRDDATKIISVRYKASDAQYVLLVLNTIADKFLEYSEEQKQINLSSGVKFIDEQLPKIKKRIQEAQNKQQELQVRYQLVDPQIKGDTVFQTNTTSNQELLTLQGQLKELNILSNNLQKDLGFSVEEALIATRLSQEPQRQQLLIQLKQVESQIALESAKLTSNHPTILNLKEQETNVRNLLDQETQKILQQDNISPNINPAVFTYQDASRIALIQKLVETQNQIDSLSSRYQLLIKNQDQNRENLAIIPGVIKEYNELQRQITLDTEILNKLSVQKETLSVEIAQKQIPWQITSKPYILTNERGEVTSFKPNPTKKLTAGIGISLLMGLLVAIAMEKRRNVFFEESDLEYAFGLPILGTIKLSSKQKKKSENDIGNFFEESEAITQIIPTTLVSLSEIYTNIHFSLPPENRKNYILVSSLNPADKQAYVCASLAKIGSKIDQKVLLIDANIVEPEIPRYFDEPTTTGLKDLLNLPIIDNSVMTEIGVKQNVSIITAESDDTEVPIHLGSEYTQSLIQSISKDYSLILYNSSFFLESHYLSVVADKTEGIVFVVRKEKTPYSLITEAVQRIKYYNLNFLGFVVIE